MESHASKWAGGLLLLLAACVCAAGPAAAQEKEEYDMGRMQVLFLSRAEGWKPAGAAEEARLSAAHKAHVEGLAGAGKLALYGPVGGEGELREILVFKTESPGEARREAAALPAVKEGMLRAEAVTWFAARNMIFAPRRPLSLAPYVFGVLVRGPRWTAEVTEETKKLQEGHMANINRLGRTGKLVLAGPFVDGGERRGVFIFKVDSLEEARLLTDTDPAVSAGRLKIELYRWSVPAGSLK